MTELTDTERVELTRTAHKRLNVGCGVYPLNFFINLDADPNVPAQIHELVPPIPFEDNSLEYVWACHFLEHLPKPLADEFMAEAFRVLEPGGRLGIVVPDTREIMTRWLEGSIDAVEYPCHEWHNVNDLDEICHLFLYSDAQDSQHQWSYDKATLARMFDRAGFVQLEEIDRYRHELIAQGAWYQVGIVGRKPFGEAEVIDGDV